MLRIARGLTQGSAADAAGITKGMLSGYECGKGAPTLATLVRLLDALGSTLSTLDATRAFLRELRGEPPTVPTEQRLRGEAMGAAVKLAACLVALAGTEGREP